jgi:metacaspase-1
MMHELYEENKEVAMEYREIWVHGIGPTVAGYSAGWTATYNQYLKFPAADYIEVLWADVYSSPPGIENLGTNNIALPRAIQEQLAEDQVRRALTTVLLARVTVQQSPALLGEWAQVTNKVATGQAGLPPWVVNPDAYVGEFVKYLVNRDVRNAVKEKMKEKIRPLVGSGYNCSVIAHSWGTVVAYESLLDLETEEPAFQLANLFTLGSPLWLVHYLLDDVSGRRPRNVANWVNIHAQGDMIGAGLTPGFRVDADYAVASFGSGDPHGSYFVSGNVAVERDIVAATILGKPVGAVSQAAAALLPAEAVPTTPEASNQN